MTTAFAPAPDALMTAMLYRQHGDLDTLVEEQIAVPSPKQGEALIRVDACALNHLDILQRRGPALIPGFELPHIAGMDVAGTIVAFGPDTDSADHEPGSRVVVNPAVPCHSCRTCLSGADGKCSDAKVIGGTIAGGYAEYVTVPVRNLHSVPDGVDMAEAACIPTIWMTADHALNVIGKVQADETVLIHAAGSGVSTAAIQLAKAAGATVISTVSSDEKTVYAEKIGSHHVIDTSRSDVVESVREFTDGAGVELVLDHVGPATFPAGIYSLAPRGRLVFFGNTTGNRAEFDLVYAYHFGLQIIGSDPYDQIEFQAMLDRYWVEDFTSPIDSSFPLTEARAAQERLESRRATGKIVLRP